jgi:hypothetical protein
MEFEMVFCEGADEIIGMVVSFPDVELNRVLNLVA